MSCQSYPFIRLPSPAGAVAFGVSQEGVVVTPMGSATVQAHGRQLVGAAAPEAQIQPGLQNAWGARRGLGGCHPANVWMNVLRVVRKGGVWKSSHLL